MDRQQDHKRGDDAIKRWYRYASEQPGFVGSALRLLRERAGISIEEQQRDFGVDDQTFLRLQGMPLPRAKSIPSDANRIAEACQLSNRLAFVRAMVMACNLERDADWEVARDAYQAAFDEEDDLDQYTEEA